MSLSKHHHLLEWVPFIRFLDGLQDALVYPECDGDGEEGQGHVGENTDDAAYAERQQEQETGSKHNPCVLHITPVQKVHHWNIRREDLMTAQTMQHNATFTRF